VRFARGLAGFAKVADRQVEGDVVVSQNDSQRCGRGSGDPCYVANGAYQAWAKTFGGTCPAPDFDGARTFWLRRAKDGMVRTAGSVWRHTGLATAMAVATALLAIIVWRRRRLRGGRAA
jgi:hypothetical protein